MFQRIPHREEGIENREKVENYEAHAEKEAWIMYKPFLRDLKQLKPTGRCLEVGAGPAVMACMFAQENPEVRLTALDISREMVEHGHKRIKRLGLSDRVDYQAGDVGQSEKMAGLGQFDLIYTTMSMHHWQDAQASLANLYSLVNEGGILYVGDLRRVWWLSWWPSNSGLFTSLRASYLPREIRKMLLNIGAKKFAIHRLPPFFFQAIIVWK